VIERRDYLRLWDGSAGLLSRERRFTWSLVALAPGGNKVVTSEQVAPLSRAEELHLWRPSNGRSLVVFSGSDQPFRAATFSPDGAVLAAVGKEVFVWDARTGAQRGRFLPEKDEIASIMVSPDGRAILAQALSSGRVEDRLTLWEVASGKRRLFVKGIPGKLDEAALSPDGRLLAVPGPGSSFRLWDLVIGKQVALVSGHRGLVTALAFAADGKTLLSGSEDTTVLVWRVDRLVPSPLSSAAELPPARLEALWRDLGGDDAEKAYEALGTLAGKPGRVESFLKRKLEQGPASPARIRRLIAELDSEEFATRQQASAELEKLGRLVEPALRQALERKPSLEAVLRLKNLLEKLKSGRFGLEEIRIERAREVLARLGTPEALRVLEAFARAGTKGAAR
jgi:hypothetical protein